MFKCGICKEQSESGETATRVITHTEPVTYPFRPSAHHFIVERSSKVKDDPGGEGFQIVKEVLAHKTCAEKFTGPQVVVRG